MSLLRDLSSYLRDFLVDLLESQEINHGRNCGTKRYGDEWDFFWISERMRIEDIGMPRKNINILGDCQEDRKERKPGEAGKHTHTHTHKDVEIQSDEVV